MNRIRRRIFLTFVLLTALLSPRFALASGADPIDEMISQMSLAEKVGQMFLADCPSNPLDTIEAYHLGGYILFADDFKDKKPKTVTKTIQGYQDASTIPMLIAVDEEGGTVTRVSRYKAFRDSKFKSPQAVYKAGGWDAIKSDVRQKAELLLPLGVNVNLAPVADVASKSGDFIYSRSFGTDPAEAAKFVSTVVSESSRQKLGAVLKHFPGYGNNRDTHNAITVDKRDEQTFRDRDLLPFQAGIEAGAQAIMFSHNIVTCFDDQYPASLSPAVHQLLRDLDFDGVMMTDDLAMGAITEAYGTGEAAVLAVEAGNDMLIARNFKPGIKAVIEAVENGRIEETRLDESVRRILLWKQALGLI